MHRFRPSSRNINRGEERGTEMIDQSMRQHGAARSGVSAADGEMIAGSHSLEVAESLSLPVREVHTTGREYVIVVRDDIPNANTKVAKLLAIADNVSTLTGFRWDTEVLHQEYEKVGLDVAPFVFANELSDVYEKERKREEREEKEDAKPTKEPEFATIMLRVPVATKARWTAMLENMDGPLAEKLEQVIDRCTR